MTLYTSAKKYVVTTIVCIIFSGVYGIFSHNVSSPFMTYMFIFPLLGSVVSFIFAFIDKIPKPSDNARKLFRCGIVTLTIGSCLRGVFDIYGTTVNLVLIYFIVGAALIVAATITWLLNMKRPHSIE